MREISEGDVLELLEARVTKLRSELKRAEEALLALKGASGSPHLITNSTEPDLLRAKKYKLPLEYDHCNKWDTKILFVISKSGTAFREDIVREINMLEPHFDPDKLTNLISVKLSALLKEDMIAAKRMGKKYQYRLF